MYKIARYGVGFFAFSVGQVMPAIIAVKAGLRTNPNAVFGVEKNIINEVGAVFVELAAVVKVIGVGLCLYKYIYTCCKNEANRYE